MPRTWSDLLVEDHNTSERVFDSALKAFEQEGGPDPAVIKGFLKYCVEYLDGCHNRKEELHLFPLAERRGIPRQAGPLAVMLMEHEQSKELLGRLEDLGNAWIAGDKRVLDRLEDAVKEYASLLKNHFWKETDILYPMVRSLLSPQDDAAVLRGIDEVEAELGADARKRYYALADDLASAGGLKDLVHNLGHDTIAAILNTLPVELSFIDANDVVQYFSHEHADKIFPRTRGAIGTNVRNCHPPKSLYLVEQILADFKAGKREVAEFWIWFSGRRVHIRYFPVLSPSGEYMGTVEVVQDVTSIQALEGERRLLAEA